MRCRGIPFTNLDHLMDGTLVPGNPDIYYGTRPEQLTRRVRNELSGHIIPSTQEDFNYAKPAKIRPFVIHADREGTSPPQRSVSLYYVELKSYAYKRPRVESFRGHSSLLFRCGIRGSIFVLCYPCDLVSRLSQCPPLRVHS
jgi:hypothetical protein